MIAVIGGGFNGIYAAWRLAHEGEEVVLLEASTRLGGGLQSLGYRGFSVDVGAQVLDFRVSRHEEFFRDVMGDDVRTLDDFSSGSSATGSIVRGIEFPDYSDDQGFSATALSQLHASLSGPTNGPAGHELTYPDLIRERFGETLGERIVAVAKKLSAGSIEQLGPGAALSFSMLSRVKLGSDAEMAGLKLSDSRLDERLAVSRECGIPQFLGKNTHPRFGYPSHGGLSSLWTAAQKRLAELGVRIEFRSSIARIASDARRVTVELEDGRTKTFAAVVWTLTDKALSLATALMDLSTSAPAPTEVNIDLYMFEVRAAEIVGPDYVNDFNLSHRASRYSSGGICSNQVRNDGTTFVTVEVNSRGKFAYRDSLGEAKEVWANLIAVGYLRRDSEPLNADVRRFPRAFVLPPVGEHQEALKATLDEAIGPRVVACRTATRGRVAFMERFDDVYLPVLRSL